MKIKIGSIVKTDDGSVGKVVGISSSGNQQFPFVYEVDCNGVVHVTNRVTPIKKLKLAQIMAITHNL